MALAQTILPTLGIEASEGTTALGRGVIVIGVMVPNNFYDPFLRPGQEPPTPPDVRSADPNGRFEMGREGKEIRKNLSLRVVGVLKETRGESDWSIYMPLDQVKLLNEWSHESPHQLQQGRL